MTLNRVSVAPTLEVRIQPCSHSWYHGVKKWAGLLMAQCSHSFTKLISAHNNGIQNRQTHPAS